MLAEAKIDVQGSGKPTLVTFQFSNTILETIQHPRIYVKLNLLVLRGLNSKHSVALYEFLSDYFNLHAFRCEIDSFRALMGIREGQYIHVTMLRRRVLDVAVDEINEKTDMQLSYEFEKVGRKITAILFKMDNKETVLDQNDPSTTIREKLKLFGLSEAKITSLLEHHDEGYLRVNIALVEEQYKKGKVKNVAGYLLQAFADDYSNQKPNLPTHKEEHEVAQQAEQKREAEKKRFEQERRAAVEEYLSTLSLDEKDCLREEFLAVNTDNLRLQKLQERNDFEHPAIQAIYFKWVKKTRMGEKWLSFEGFEAVTEI